MIASAARLTIPQPRNASRKGPPYHTLANFLLSFSGQQDHLFDWLNNTTFPTEARFKDLEYARETYENVVTRVLNNGVGVMSFSESR